jgi:hypothetical protein
LRKRNRPEAPPSEFSDAVSIQIPSAVPTSARKPYFIFGDSQNSVDLWFYDLARPDPLQFTGKGSADIAPNDTGDVSGVASYNDGEWSVIFKRPLRPSGAAAFTPGEFLPIAFSVWDGASRERGNRRGLTVWESVYMEPEVVPSAAGAHDQDGGRAPRHRVGDHRLGAAAPWLRRPHGPRQRADAAVNHESVSGRKLSGGSGVQEHLRSRR